MIQNTYNNDIPLKVNIADTTVTVIGTKQDSTEVPIKIKIVANQLNYGPVIDIQINCDVPYVNGEWIDHPFRTLYTKDFSNELSEIIDDTPAIRAIIEELINPNKKNLYTTTDCTHRAALIASLNFFWS